MRIWSLHPQHLDRQALIACWRETLLAQAVIAGFALSNFFTSGAHKPENWFKGQAKPPFNLLNLCKMSMNLLFMEQKLLYRLEA